MLAYLTATPMLPTYLRVLRWSGYPPIHGGFGKRVVALFARNGGGRLRCSYHSPLLIPSDSPYAGAIHCKGPTAVTGVTTRTIQTKA